MFQEAYTKLDQKKAEKVLKDIGPLLKGVSTDTDALTLLSNELSFYPGYKIIDLTDHSQTPPARRLAIHKAGDGVLIDWTNAPIYGLNARAPLLLNENTAVDYVRFFFGHVRGRNGRFQIVESVDDIIWRESPPPAARKAISRLLEPLHITDALPDGSFRLKLCAVYKTGLFGASVHVSAQGQVETKDEDLLVEDLPVVDDVLGP